MRVIASALLLYKDDLNNRLGSVKSDLLMPTEANFLIELELSNLNQDFDGFYFQYGESALLEELRSRRERKSGLAYPSNIEAAELIQEGEGQTIEFKKQLPKQADSLAKEIAALGSTNPGVILLGVAKNSDIIGIDEIATPAGLDEFRTRIEGIS